MLADLLKHKFAGWHRRVEAHPFQQQLARRPDPQQYVDYLGQLAVFQQQLEEALREFIPHSTELNSLAKPRHFRAPLAIADLEWLRLRQGLTPSFDCAAELACRWRDPCVIAGALYVTEGSTNGGRYLAAAVRTALGLPDRHGASFLDPYGDHQRENWSVFKADLNALKLSDDQLQSLFAGVSDAYAAYEEMSDSAVGR